MEKLVASFVAEKQPIDINQELSAWFCIDCICFNSVSGHLVQSIIRFFNNDAIESCVRQLTVSFDMDSRCLNGCL